MMGGPIVPLTVEHAALIESGPDRVIEMAKGRHCFPWWDSDDPYVIAPRQLLEPVLLVPFDRLKKAVELVLGRDVAAAEFIDREKLFEELHALTRRASR